LGPLIGANLTFNIKGKGPEGSNAAEQKKKNEKSKQPETLDPAQKKDQQEQEQKAAAATWLFMPSIFHKISDRYLYKKYHSPYLFMTRTICKKRLDKFTRIKFTQII
jgi:hypothetical protein